MIDRPEKSDTRNVKKMRTTPRLKMHRRSFLRLSGLPCYLARKSIEIECFRRDTDKKEEKMLQRKFALKTG